MFPVHTHVKNHVSTPHGVSAQRDDLAILPTRGLLWRLFRTLNFDVVEPVLGKHMADLALHRLPHLV